MREIKFRAWDEFQKKMFNVDVLALSACRWDCPDYNKYGVSLAYQPQKKVMQYTGLHDKNGKEIYEGDVIQFIWPEDSCWGKAGTYKGYIRFNEGVFEVAYIGREKYTIYSDGYKYENSQSDDIQSFSSWSEDIEVIGNIFENPKLFNA